MKMRVTQGQIVINEVVQVVDNPDCRVYHADLASKYPLLLAASSYGEGKIERGVSLIATDETLGARANVGPSEIMFELPDSDWQVIADSGRYSVQICLYRWRAISELLYQATIGQALSAPDTLIAEA